MRRNQNLFLRFLGEKVTYWYVFRLFDFWNFFFRPSFFSFSLVFAVAIELLLGLLAVEKLLTEKASSRQVIFSMEHPSVVAGNFQLQGFHSTF